MLRYLKKLLAHWDDVLSKLAQRGITINMHTGETYYNPPVEKNSHTHTKQKNKQ